ncbi:MAG: proteasome activator [Actinomycetota bacterium]
MADQQEPEVIIVPPQREGELSRTDEQDEDAGEVRQPAKVMRIASMIRTLLEEVRAAPLDEASRSRLREVYQTSVVELSEVLSDDLREELERLSFPFEGTPSDAELRVAHAQLVGWLEGLFHGIQAMIFAQQMETRNRAMEEAQRRGLPAPPDQPPGHGQYL